MSARIDRRGLLVGGAAALAGWSLAGGARAARRETAPAASEDSARAEPARTLLLLEISGGNDGLSTVVPFEDPAYRAARTRTAIAREQVLRIDAARGLHPHLAGLHGLYGEGRLAIVEGVGYPRPNLSHFTSQDVWHTGRAEGRASGEGWIGRTLRARHPSDVARARAVHVGAVLPYSMTSSTHPIVHLETPSAYRWVNEGPAIAAAAELPPEGAGREVRDLRALIRDARSSSTAIRRAVGLYRPRVEYPDHPLAAELRIAAALLQGGIGLEVVSVTHTGYDTHDNQRVRHDALLRELDESLCAFFADLRGTPAGNRLAVLVFSEFGRRVADNASQGTDHGTAGPVFVLGDAVRGGIHGRACSLVELAAGDLVHTTDFRSVYASVLEGWLGTPAEDVLGARFPLLSLFA